MGALMGNTLMKGTSAGCGRGGSGPGGSGRRAAGLRALGLGAVVLLGLSACSGTPEVPAQTSISLGTPSTLASTTPSPSASPSPSATASPSNAYEPATSTSPAKNVPKPVMPALAKEKSFEGQKAFIKYWLETYNYSFNTGDSNLMDRSSAKDCDFCTKSGKGARTMYTIRKTWRTQGGAILSETTFKQLPDQNGLSVVRAEVTENEAAFWTRSGPSTRYKNLSKAKNSLRFWAEYVGGRWLMVDVRKEPK